MSAPKGAVSGRPTKRTVRPVVSVSSRLGRAAHVAVGPAVAARRERSGPLAHVELAEQVQHQLQRMLDSAVESHE